ncbi:MAG: ATPase [Candidatus Limnocylindrales bacterium]
MTATRRHRRPRALLSWSSGKDAAFALHELRRGGEVDVVGLMTTLTERDGRVAMHGVSETLLDRQVAATGLPCLKIVLPWPCPNPTYERLVRAALIAARAQGIEHVVFGDLFLGEIRAYREALLAPTGLSALYPLWGRPTEDLARAMMSEGLEAVLACVDPARVDPAWAGRSFDATLLAELPDTVDRCGENGEFHTFVTAGPMLTGRVDVRVDGTVERDGFVYADLAPAH